MIILDVLDDKYLEVAVQMLHRYIKGRVFYGGGDVEALFCEALNLVFSSTTQAETWFREYYPDGEFTVSEKVWLK